MLEGEVLAALPLLFIEPLAYAPLVEALPAVEVDDVSLYTPVVEPVAVVEVLDVSEEDRVV